jgi:hypothetical protein
LLKENSSACQQCPNHRTDFPSSRQAYCCKEQRKGQRQCQRVCEEDHINTNPRPPTPKRPTSQSIDKSNIPGANKVWIRNQRPASTHRETYRGRFHGGIGWPQIVSLASLELVCENFARISYSVSMNRDLFPRGCPMEGAGIFTTVLIQSAVAPDSFPHLFGVLEFTPSQPGNLHYQNSLVRSQ